MKRTSLWGLILTLALGSLAADEKKADVLLQAAMAKETVQGDLKGAIALYESAVKEAGPNRALAAKALLKAGECYQKLGEDKAQAAYERVAREFADQKEPAAEARTRLASLRGAAPAKIGMVTRQVWTGPKVDILGTVSPDGRHLSFVDWETGDLAVHDLTTGKDRRLTNKGSWAESDEFAEESAISPDGKQVVYGWFNKDFHFELRLMDLSDGAAKPRSLFGNPEVEWIAPYSWSDDGKWIAVALQRTDRTAQIGLISATDGSLRVLKSVDWRAVTKMAFSPDGKYLAYDLPVADDSEQRDVFLIATDGSRETPLVVHPANDVVLGWTPDGAHLLFASDRTGAMGVWALPVSGGKPAGEPLMIKPDIGEPRSVGLSRSGALYFGVRLGGPDVYVASLDFQTGKLLSPPARATEQFVGTNRQPRWSQDGKYLAYSSVRDPVGYRPVVVIRSLETGQVRELRPNLNYLNQFLWAPDGRSLAGRGSDKKGRGGIYRIDAQTGDAAPLALSEAGDTFTSPQLSPDGKTLYYKHNARDAKESRAVARDLNSGAERVVLRLTSPFFLSPDGHQLAYTTPDPASKSVILKVVPVAGGEPRELCRLQVNMDQAQSLVGGGWSADSQFLVFFKKTAATGGASAGGELWRIPVSGGEPQKVKVELPVAQMSRIFSIHPDGQRIAYTAGEQKQEVWVMENFLSRRTAGK